MDLEFHQLDLRYEVLRSRSFEREKRLISSLAQHGQQVPIVVVAGQNARHIVVDGYKRVRALKVLKADTVQATGWDLSELDALLLERLMRCADGDNAIEQAWLLRELHSRFALSHEEMARRFDKSQSWVSRRLALIEGLPEEIQEQVRKGAIVAHAAMKYLVPMARANLADALQLVAGIVDHRPSSRQVGALYGAWLTSDLRLRKLLLKDPWLYLRALEEKRREKKAEKTPAQQLLADFEVLGAISRRVCSKLRQGVAEKLLATEREEIHRCMRQAKTDVEQLFALGQKELTNA